MNTINETEKIIKNKFYSCEWIGEDTFICYIAMSDKLKDYLSDIIEDDDVSFLIEYWKDKNVFKYLLKFSDDTVLINDRVECDKINNLVFKLSEII